MDLLSAARRPAGSFRDRVAHRPSPGLRIRYSCQNPITPVEAHAERAVLGCCACSRILDITSSLGCHPPDPWKNSADVPLPRRQDVRPGARPCAASNPPAAAGGTAVTMETALAARELFRRIDAWLADAHVYVTPTVPRDAQGVGSFASVPPEELLGQVAPYGAFTAPLQRRGESGHRFPCACQITLCHLAYS